MAVEDLDPCVKQILCSLSDAALRSIQILIDGQVALIQAQIVVFQTQILQYDVLGIPIQVAQQAAQAIVDDVKESISFLPLNAVAGCIDLGDFNLNLTQSIDVATSVANDFLNEATRLLSYGDELRGLVNDLNETIDQFTDISSVIDECLAGL